MAANEVEILARETCLPSNIAPNGRMFGVVMERERILFKIVYIDKSPGEVPDELKGHWTKADLAESCLKDHLTKLWDISDRSAQKAYRREYKKEQNGQLESTGASL